MRHTETDKIIFKKYWETGNIFEKFNLLIDYYIIRQFGYYGIYTQYTKYWWGKTFRLTFLTGFMKAWSFHNSEGIEK